MQWEARAQGKLLVRVIVRLRPKTWAEASGVSRWVWENILGRGNNRRP